MSEQISLFEEEQTPSVCCYQCQHFAEFKEAREFVGRSEGDVSVFGVCVKSFCKNGCYLMYPIYVPGGVCKDFKKRRIIQ